MAGCIYGTFNLFLGMLMVLFLSPPIPQNPRCLVEAQGYVCRSAIEVSQRSLIVPINTLPLFLVRTDSVL